jgi:hypothetical protein
MQRDRKGSLTRIAPQREQGGQRECGQRAQSAWIEPDDRQGDERQRSEDREGGGAAPQPRRDLSALARPRERHGGERYTPAVLWRAECHVPTADKSHRPKLVNATITVSIQYWERIASWAF